MKLLSRTINLVSTTWTSYWFKPAPLGDLAISRIMIIGYQLFHMINQNWIVKFRTLSSLPDALYDPLPILHLLISPFGWNFRPPIGLLEVIFWLTFTVGVLAFIGFKTKPSLILFALGSAFMHAFTYSHQDYHHPPGIMVIGLTALALSPAGKRFSVDSFLARKSGGVVSPHTSDTFARWPLLLVQWIFAFAYFSAAKSKLVAGGLEWMNGYTLQQCLAMSAMRHNLALGVWFSQHHTLALLLSWITMFFEGTFFLILMLPSLVWLYIPMGVMLHAGMYLTMGANFFQWIALYAVFIPWVEVMSTVKCWRKRIILPANRLVTGDVNE